MSARNINNLSATPSQSDTFLAHCQSRKIGIQLNGFQGDD
jgi:hypothetical protein